MILLLPRYKVTIDKRGTEHRNACHICHIHNVEECKRPRLPVYKGGLYVFPLNETGLMLRCKNGIGVLQPLITWSHSYCMPSFLVLGWPAHVVNIVQTKPGKKENWGESWERQERWKEILPSVKTGPTSKKRSAVRHGTGYKARYKAHAEDKGKPDTDFIGFVDACDLIPNTRNIAGLGNPYWQLAYTAANSPKLSKAEPHYRQWRKVFDKTPWGAWLYPREAWRSKAIWQRWSALEWHLRVFQK